MRLFKNIIGDVAPVKAIHGRSKDAIQRRQCCKAENFVDETLPHVLGQCPLGALIQNHRRSIIRTLIANESRKNQW